MRRKQPKKTDTFSQPVAAGETTRQLTITITAEEYRQYFYRPLMTLYGISALARDNGYTKGWLGSPLSAGFYAMNCSADKLGDLQAKIARRFTGDSLVLAANDDELQITEDEAKQYEEALGPACAFVELFEDRDFGGNSSAEEEKSVSLAGTMLLYNTLEATKLFKARLQAQKEGAA
jgi:hypothetical protein